MEVLAWYRRIAPSYDAVCRPLYGATRRAALRALEAGPGERVLDLCCGTGLSLTALAHAVGVTGRVVGVDGSPQMLARARRRAAATPQVHLLEADLREDQGDRLLAAAAAPAFDALHVGLTLAVVDDWQEVFARAWALLRPGGRCVVWDTRPLRGLWRPCNPLVVPLAGWTGRADLRRPTWTVLDGRAEQLAVRHRLGGYLYIACGRRPSA